MTVETEKVCESATAKLQGFCSSVYELAHKLEEYECFASNPSVDFVNVKMEVKEMRQTFLDLTSYAMFLSMFIKPTDQWLKLDDVKAQSKQTFEGIAAADKQYEECVAKEKKLLQFIEEAWNQAKQIKSFEEIQSEIDSKKASCEQLTQHLTTIAEAFNGKLLNESDTKACFMEQQCLIQKLKRDIDMIGSAIKSVADPALMSDMNQLLTDKKDSNHESQTEALFSMELKDLEKNEQLSCVKVVMSEPTCEVLEVGYSDNLGKESSIEVKILFDAQASLRKVRDVIFHNCPVHVDDIVADAIELNSFSDLIPELLDRLFNSEYC